MIISCKSCLAKFRIDQSDIGQKGRFVRCSLCGYEWLAKEDEDDGYHTKSVKLNLDSNFERQKKYPKIKNNHFLTVIILMIIVMIILLALIVTSRNNNFTKNFDFIINHFDDKKQTTELELTSISIDHGPNQSSIIRLSILNKSAKIKVIDSLKIILITDQDQLFADFEVEPHKIIHSNQEANFNIKANIDKTNEILKAKVFLDDVLIGSKIISFQLLKTG